MYIISSLKHHKNNSQNAKFRPCVTTQNERYLKIELETKSEKEKFLGLPIHATCDNVGKIDEGILSPGAVTYERMAMLSDIHMDVLVN